MVVPNTRGVQIRERLDRVLVSKDWILKFPDIVVFHKSSSTFDHSPLLLKFCLKLKRKKPRILFIFKPMWLKDPRCEQIVIEVWLEGAGFDSPFPILSCMDSCRTKLAIWNQTDFGHVGKQISQLQKHLEWLELQPTSREIINDLRETRVQLNCWLDKEDAMWKQWSRINWFKKGDCNTRFFHAKASAWYQKNLIESIYDEARVWQEDERVVETIFQDYYSELFASSNPSEFTKLL